jgi:hypothetical protein
MTVKMFSWKSIGERQRRRKPTMRGTGGHFRIVPIRSDAVAAHLCHQGRVPIFNWRATFHQLSPSLEDRYPDATHAC